MVKEEENEGGMGWGGGEERKLWCGAQMPSPTTAQSGKEGCQLAQKMPRR